MTKENKGKTAIIAAVLIFIAGCAGQTTGPPPKSGIAPAQESTIGPVGNFSLKDIDGQPHTLSDYLGKQVIVLSFFATWCEPCKMELMQLRDYYAGNKNAGFQILAIAMDEPETQGDVRPFAKHRGLNFPVLLDTELEAVTAFNPNRQAPFTVVIDKEPSIYWSHYGYAPGDEKQLQEIIEAAVSQRLE